MKVALIGGTGRTGRLVLDRLLEHGHDVCVLARRRSAIPAHTGDWDVCAIEGDARDVDTLQALLAGADAVVSALGPTDRESRLHTETAAQLVHVMRTAGPRRFVGVSGAGMDVPGDHKSARARAISKLSGTFGGSVVADKATELQVWQESGLEWTLVRPPRLVDGAATGEVEHRAHHSTKRTRITRADLASFVVDVVEGDLYVAQAPFVANT